MISPRTLIDVLRAHKLLAVAFWLAVAGVATTAVSCGAADDAGDSDGAVTPAVSTQSQTEADAETPASTQVSGISVYAGTGKGFFEGDGGLATDAFVRVARDVAVDGEGNLYFTAEDRVRKVDAATGIITTLTGTGVNDLSGDGGPSEAAGISDPLGITLDDQGNIYYR